jgi:hypothetical protein
MKIKNLVGLIAAVAVLPWQTGYAQPAPAAEVEDLPPQVQSSAAVPTDLSPAAGEVVRLAESGVGEDVIVSYVQNTRGAFGLTADHILYLKDLGLASETITAMLNHDKGLPPGTLPAPVVEAPTVPSAPQVMPQPGQPAQPGLAVAQSAPAYVSNPPAEVNYFYNDLSPYGTWISLEGYGWCWQPRAVVVNRAWRPYCDGGHWTYTDAGWYWQSDYSWGWAPFHYGRWSMHDRCGWVWIPDRVWAPAWVVWRSYGDNCGWAPVPPRATFDLNFGWRFNGVSVGVNFDFGLRSDHFTFIATRDFNHRDYGRYRMPRTEVTKIYNRTTVINNYTVVNKTIVNRGIPVERVASATHSEVRRASIRDLPAGANRNVVTRTADRNGVIYRPQLRAPSRPVNVVAQRVDERHPVIRHSEIATAPAPRRSDRDAYRSAQPGNNQSYRLGRPDQGRDNDNRQPSPGTYRAPQAPSDRTPDRRDNRNDTRRVPSAQSAPSAPSAPPAARSSDDYRPAPRSNPGNRVYQAPASIPPGQVRQAEVRGRQPETRGQNPHVYAPKTAQQSSDVRRLPPERSRENRGNNSNNSNSNSRSRKHDD